MEKQIAYRLFPLGICWVLLCLHFWTLPALAVDRNSPITSLRHATWGAAQGLPGQVWSIQQTPDGYIWAATRDDVYRFDGVRFESLETVCQCTRKTLFTEWIYASPTGVLWISGEADVMDRLVDRHVTSFKVSKACGQLLRMVEDFDGNDWAVGEGGLCELKGANGFDLVTPAGLPRIMATDIFLDVQGTIWIRTFDDGLYFSRRGTASFSKNASGSSNGHQFFIQKSIAQTPDGRLWSSNAYGLRRIYTGQEDAHKRPLYVIGADDPGNKYDHLKPVSLLGTQEPSGAILADREGTLWIAVKEGLLRIQSPSELKQHSITHQRVGGGAFTLKDGLSSDIVWSLLEDREGNVWVGTNSGIDRFSSENFTKAPFPVNRQTQFVLAADEGGAIWAGNFDTPVARLSQGIVKRVKGLPDAHVDAIYEAPNHIIWVATGKEIWNGQGNSFSKIPLPAKWPLVRVLGIGAAEDGSLWMSFESHGIYRLFQGTWTDENSVLGIPDNVNVGAFGSDSSGAIWFAGSKAVFEYKQSELHKIKFPKVPNAELQIYGSDVWLAGTQQLAVFRDGQLRFIKGRGNERFGETSGVVETESGDVWLNGLKGAELIPAEEIRRALTDDTYQVAYQTFGEREGIDGYGDLTYPRNAVLGSHGLVWMGTNKGVFSIDPRQYARQKNTAPPRVLIDTLKTDSKLFLVPGLIQIPPKSLNVEIEYTALSFTKPEGIQFKYKLTGVDSDWHMAGTRRQALYNSLSPGRYTFVVMAMTSDGIWSDSEAKLSFQVLPAFYQTWWFRMFEVLLCLGCIWLMFRIQLSRSNFVIRSRLNARLQERARIARELHDTLLQGFHGLVLRFQTASTLLENPVLARAALEDALDRADSLMIESRERIRDLRYESEEVVRLPEALEAAGEQMTDEYRGNFRFTVEGAVRVLNPQVREEMYLVGREALSNAFAHSNGSEVEAELTFHQHWVRLRVRDNGDGIDPETLRSGGAVGHWGISGMHERAEKIGAQFKMWNREGAGCEVELKLSATLAYQTLPKQTIWKRMKCRVLSFRIGSSRNPESSES